MFSYLSSMKFTEKSNSFIVRHSIPEILAILVSSLSGIPNGMLYSWTSPAIPELINDQHIPISLEDASYLTVISPVAMIMAAPLVSTILEIYGRKVAVLFVSVPQLLAWIIISLADNIWLYYVSRILSGISDAAYYGAVPVYVCEISKPAVRDFWGNAVAINAYFGTFLINLIGAYYNIKTTALICCCFPILHIVFFSFMPESPYYLLKKGKEERANTSLISLRWTNNIEEELKSLKLDVLRQISERGTFRDLLIINSNRRALLICILARVSQHVAGIPAFESYTQYMFQKAGNSISEKTSSVIFTGVMFVFVFISVYIIKRIRRRPLMILSCLGSGITLGMLGGYLYLNRWNNTSNNWIPLIGMLVYLAAYSPGIGILPTLMVGELFSTSIKGKAISVLNVVFGLGYLIVPKAFQLLTHNVGLYASFLMFSVSCFVCCVLSYLCIVETKGKTLEEIQQELKGNKTI